MPAAPLSRGPRLVRCPAVTGAAVQIVHLLAVWCVVAATASPADAQAVGGPADVAAVRAASQAYRDALATGDVAAVRAAWTADGDIVDSFGRRLRADEPGALDGGTTSAGEPRPQFRIDETQIRFLAADVAVEDGTVDVLLPGTTTPVEGWFSALWVRSGDDWKLAGLRESERPTAGDANLLDDLGWLVGEWTLDVDQPVGTEAAVADPTEMTVRWNAGRTFLIRDIRVAAADGDAVDYHQRIGWDPVVRRIRSWSFATDGSRSEATWFRDGDSWVAVQTGIMPDGRQDSVVNIYSHDGRDRCVWRILPDALDVDDGRPTRATWVRTPKGVDQ